MSSMQAINVRPALPSDAPAVSQLRLEALHDHPEAFSSDYQVESARSLADWEASIRRADGTHGVDILKLGVTDANAGAIRFYAGLGFRVYGLEPSATRVQNVDGVRPTDYAELLMALEL